MHIWNIPIIISLSNKWEGVITVDTPANVASVVEEAVDDVEEEDKEAKKSKNSIGIHHISVIFQIL